MNKVNLEFILFIITCFSLPVSATMQKTIIQKIIILHKQLISSFTKEKITSKRFIITSSVYQQEHQTDPLLIIFQPTKTGLFKLSRVLLSGYIISILPAETRFFAAPSWDWPSCGPIARIGNALLCSGNRCCATPVTSPTIRRLPAPLPNSRGHSAGRCCSVPAMPLHR